MGSTGALQGRHVSTPASPGGVDYTRDELLHMLGSSPLPQLGTSPLRRGSVKKPGDSLLTRSPDPQLTKPPAEWDGTGKRVRPHSLPGRLLEHPPAVPSRGLPVHAMPKRLPPLSGSPNMSHDAVYADWISAQKSGQRSEPPPWEPPQRQPIAPK